MQHIRVLAAAVAAAGYVLGAAGASATTYTPHEKTYSTPQGFEFTVGNQDQDVRAVPPMNGMPTNREVFLDNTSYGKVAAGGKGHVKAGYYVACQVDVDAKLHIDPELDPNPTVTAHAGVGLDGPQAGVDLSLGPAIYGGVGLDIYLAPGKIADVTAGEKDLPGDGSLAYLMNNDFHLNVTGCGGQLTLRPYTIITANSDGDSGSGAVYGDLIVL
ncbi:MspA family porin [Nocardia sp. SYP-A9097]|uniref:MspA family porin n=1 Tax=Nocardia sp. SYP-A9097 TaxID=2663237 RepID=UPI001891EBCE|nr:MspA family porin [Nocardia sp. SYP-A9097]